MGIIQRIWENKNNEFKKLVVFDLIRNFKDEYECFFKDQNLVSSNSGHISDMAVLDIHQNFAAILYGKKYCSTQTPELHIYVDLIDPNSIVPLGKTFHLRYKLTGGISPSMYQVTCKIGKLEDDDIVEDDSETIAQVEEDGFTITTTGEGEFYLMFTLELDGYSHEYVLGDAFKVELVPTFMAALDRLNQSKANMKTALQQKGLSVTIPFEEYSTLIENLQTVSKGTTLRGICTDLGIETDGTESDSDLIDMIAAETTTLKNSLSNSANSIDTDLSTETENFYKTEALKILNQESSNMELVDGIETIPSYYMGVTKSSGFENETLVNVIIPSTVKEIGNYCFKKGVESLTLNEGLKHIGYESIQDFNIKTLTLPSTLEWVGGNSLKHLGISSIHIPKNVKLFGDTATYLSKGFWNGGHSGACHYCPELATITVDAENETYMALNNDLFSKDGKVLYLVSSAKTGTYTVPATVEYICDNAFINAEGITKIEFASGSNYKTITDAILNVLGRVDEIVFPSSVETIRCGFTRYTNFRAITLTSNKMVAAFRNFAKHFNGILFVNDNLVAEYKASKTYEPMKDKIYPVSQKVNVLNFNLVENTGFNSSLYNIMPAIETNEGDLVIAHFITHYDPESETVNNYDLPNGWTEVATADAIDCYMIPDESYGKIKQVQHFAYTFAEDTDKTVFTLAYKQAHRSAVDEKSIYYGVVAANLIAIPGGVSVTLSNDGTTEYSSETINTIARPEANTVLYGFGLSNHTENVVENLGTNHILTSLDGTGDMIVPENDRNLCMISNDKLATILQKGGTGETFRAYYVTDNGKFNVLSLIITMGE